MFGHLLLLLIAIETIAVLSTTSVRPAIINHTPSASSPLPDDIWIQIIPHLDIRDQIRFSITNHRNRILIVSNLILFYPHYVKNYLNHFNFFLNHAPSILKYFSITAENIVHIYDRLQVACRNDLNNQLLLELDEEEETITTDYDESKILMDQLLSILQKDDLNELVAGLRVSAKTVAEILTRVRDQISSDSFDKQLKGILPKFKDEDSLDEIRMLLLSELYQHDGLDFETLLILLKCGIRFDVNEFLLGAAFPDGIPHPDGSLFVFPFTQSSNNVVYKTIHPTVFPLLNGSFWDESNALNKELVMMLLHVPDERFPFLIRIPNVFDHLLHHAEGLLEYVIEDEMEPDFSEICNLILHLIRTEPIFFNKIRNHNKFGSFIANCKLGDFIDFLLSVPGLGINTKLDDDGNMAAHLYLKNGGQDLASFLSRPGFDRSVRNKNGDTLLHTAVQADTDLSLLWPELSIEPSDTNSGPSEPQFREIGEGLIQINVQNASCQTALHIAVQRKRYQIVKQLLAHPGIDPNLKDDRGRSALDIALEQQDDQIIELIATHPKFDLIRTDFNPIVLCNSRIERVFYWIMYLLSCIFHWIFPRSK